MTDTTDLVERVRRQLADRDPREVAMFGGTSFMVGDRMVAAARRNHELLLRIDPADSERLLSEPGARPAQMGSNRAMGPGWITVQPEALAGGGLAAWLSHALTYHASRAEQ